jgi:hypothetical protein
MTLPKHVTAFKDRHGAMRYRYRRAGHRSAYLPDINSGAFLDAYAACMGGTRASLGLHWKAIDVAVRPTKGVGYVYFVGDARGSVKIGHSIDLASRLERLRVSSSTKLTLLAFEEGGMADEAAYHARFQSFQKEGEWFAANLEMWAEIKRIREALCLTFRETSKKLDTKNRQTTGNAQ